MLDNQELLRRQRRNLRIVLVLSLIGSAYGFINNLFTCIALPFLTSQYQAGVMEGPIALMCNMAGVPADLFKASFEEMLAVPRTFYLISGLLYGCSLAGVILMFCFKKNGFHFYTIAQLLILIVTILFLGKSHVPLGDIMFTALFIGYYFLSLKNLGIINTPAESQLTQEPESQKNSEEDDPENTNEN